MNEDQRELTDDELRDGIPVSPVEAEDVIDEIELLDEDDAVPTDATPEPAQKEGEEVATGEADSFNPLDFERPIMSLEPRHLTRFGYVIRIRGPRGNMDIMTAEGTRHCAQAMGIRLVDFDIREEGDEWIYANATAFDPQTQSNGYGHVKQPTKHNNGKVDQQAYEKAVTRAQRNALKQLVPCQRLVAACKPFLA